MCPGDTHSSTIRALEPCKVLSWSLEDFDRLCSRTPALQRNALQIMNDTLHILQECFCEMATLRVPSRLARTLVRLAEQDGYAGQNAPITFTCEELGQMTGTTLFTVSRLLCKWTEMGLIYPEKRGVVIQDVGGLLAIADESPVPARQIAANGAAFQSWSHNETLGFPDLRAEAANQNEMVIAALKRCATRNQLPDRVFQQRLNPYPSKS